MTARRWSVWVDTGGTFTDCLAVAPDASVHRTKVLSSGRLRGRLLDHGGGWIRIEGPWPASPEFLRGFRMRVGEMEPVPILDVESDGRVVTARPLAETPEAGATVELFTGEPAPILAARLVTGRGPEHALPPLDLRLATTRATNALLERKGARTALVVTRGFADLLTIGTQQRPDLFALNIVRPLPLADAVFEIGGRLDAGGAEIAPLEPAELEDLVRSVEMSGAESVAVSLLHAWANPAHEKLVEERLRSAGFRHVTSGADLSRGLHYLNRTRTAVANAYLAPVMEDYLATIRSSLPAGSSLRVMTSAGGLVDVASYRAKDSLLSGPAAGVVGAAGAGGAAGLDRIIAFDMGGTSTDVARVDGDLEYSWLMEVGDLELVAPTVAIHTVAAGGGSICQYVRGALQVGPESAGADPGPACYGAGGPLTLTDCNLLLGRLDESHFRIPVQREAADLALDAVIAAMRADGAGVSDRTELLEGLIAIANERMAEAVRRISLRQGYDPAGYALLCFGGAGGQHACGIAAHLGVRRIAIPPDPALLSARGLGLATHEEVVEMHFLEGYGDGQRLSERLAEVEQRALSRLADLGVAQTRSTVHRRLVDARLPGQEAALTLEVADPATLPSEFRKRYRATFGYPPPGEDLEIVALRVVAREAAREALPATGLAVAEDRPGNVRGVRLGGRWMEIPVIARDSLREEGRIEGPALIEDPYSTVLLEGEWAASRHASGALLLEHTVAEPNPSSTHSGAVRQTLFTSRFEALVGQMGEQLRRTSISVNIRERLDFSCALLDATGTLVANAPHIPVHLGALGLCIRTVVENTVLLRGDIVVTNHPRYGGSHLPDVTVITPIFESGKGKPIGYVANRAHHAEIGGQRPGSMPPDARLLEDEGIAIEPVKVIEGGEPKWERVEKLLRGGPWPSRAVADNLADLRAQVAANQRGRKLLEEMISVHGAAEVSQQMRNLTNRAARLARAAISERSGQSCTARERLDDGHELAVRIEFHPDSALFDFTGSSDVHPGNLNATPAIVRSVVLYVMRLLIGEEIPLNEGLLRDVEIRLPPGLLNPPFDEMGGDAPAIVGGNTEVSQRLTDALVRALQLSACGQGTMNNVLWGNDDFGYYETVGGGSGAGPGFDGCSGVHVHMTNTRITDAEVLEHRYPVRVVEHSLRGGSGGSGRWRGGDGVRRVVEFLAPMSLSLLSQHRREAPFGMAGGSPGATGRQWIERAGGSRTDLAGIDGAEVRPGDRLVLETPGGGGWGSSTARGPEAPE